LAHEDKVTAADGADRFLPEQVDAVAGHDAELEVWLVLKHRRGRREHDVGQQDVLGVQATGPLIAAIIGTLMSSRFMRTFLPSRKILS
jgi:hypothetical protein